jgi:predicted phosphodiesterase
MIKIIHISDTHFHTNADDNKAAGAFLSGVMNEYFLSGDNYLLHTGDVTDDGHPEQYDNARGALLPFGRGRVLVCPGNHDYGPSGVFYSEAAGHRFDDCLAAPLGYAEPYFPKKQPVVRVLRDADGSRVMTIGINAVLETLNPFDFSCGEVGVQQLAVLDAILANPAAAPIPKLVYLHFHPFMHTHRTMKLLDAAAFLAVLRGRVQVLCFGHKHEQKSWPTSYGVDAILAAGAAYDIKKVWEISFASNRLAGVTEAVIPEL